MQLTRFGLVAAVLAVGLSVPVLGVPSAQAMNVCDSPSPATGVTVTCGATGGGTGTVMVPADATSVTVTVIGAGGAGGAGDLGSGAGGDGGDGAKVTGTLALNGQTTLDVVVGAPGAVTGRFLGGTGGGYSAISSTAGPLAVAGGGGGGGGNIYVAPGGAGGDGAGTGTSVGGHGADFVSDPSHRADGGRGGADGSGGNGGTFVDAADIVNGQGTAGQPWSAGGAGGSGGSDTYIDTTMSGGGGGGGYGGGGGGALMSHGAAGGGAGGSYASPAMSGVSFAPAGSGPGAGSPGVAEVAPSTPKAQAGQVVLTFSAEPVVTPALEVTAFSANQTLLLELKTTGLPQGEFVTSGRAWATEADRECTIGRTRDIAYCFLKELENGKVYSVTAMVTTNMNRTLLAREVKFGMPLAPNTAPRVPDGPLKPRGWRAAAQVNGQWAEVEVSYDATAGSVSARLTTSARVLASTETVLDKGHLQTLYNQAFAIFTQGFAKDSLWLITLFSKKHVLGKGTVNADGEATGKYTVPKRVAPGKHTLQLNGFLASGLPVTVDLPIRVSKASATMTRSGANKAKVQVLPICRSHYSFTVQKKAGNRWVKALSAKTKGSTQARTVKLPPGTYRAQVAKQCGHPTTTTKPVRIGKQPLATGSWRRVRNR